MDHAERHMAVVDSATEALSAEVLSSQGREALKNITFGSIAGMVGKVIEYPFDTVKVRLQSQPDHLPLLYKGPLDCFKKSLKNDGVLGIYRGISAPMVGAAVETSCLFFSYRIAQDALQATFYAKEEELPMRALLLCGAASGAFTSLFLTPIELIKCKVQVPLETPGMVTARPGMLQLITSVYRHQGVFGFWRGQMGTFIRETGGSAAWFGSYEGTSLFFRKMRDERADATLPLPIYQRLIAGATAGMSYNFIFYPADTVKSRMQTEDVTRITGGKQSFWTVTKALWRQQGLKGMYRGCGITVARSAPSSALIFTVHDILMRSFA